MPSAPCVGSEWRLGAKVLRCCSETSVSPERPTDPALGFHDAWVWEILCGIVWTWRGQPDPEHGRPGHVREWTGRRTQDVGERRHERRQGMSQRQEAGLISSDGAF